MPENSKSSFEAAYKNNPLGDRPLLNPFGPMPENNKSSKDFCFIMVRVVKSKNLVMIRETCGIFTEVKTYFFPNRRRRYSSYKVSEVNFSKK